VKIKNLQCRVQPADGHQSQVQFFECSCHIL
jgi:hypothetical protein